MKSSITNCNSNDHLLQLVSIQLLHKAYFRQLMFEDANYFTSPSFAELADRESQSQGSSSSTSAANARSYLSQYMSDWYTVQGTAAEYWQQKLVANPQCAAVPLVAQDVISAPASQAFVERLFSVCGLLTKGTCNCIEKSLYMRAWLKVNFHELSDML